MDFEADRRIAVTEIRGILPEFTGSGLRHTVVMMWLENRAWLVGDLHERNIMRDQDGTPTIIDALIGPVPPAALGELRWLREATEDALALRENRPAVKRQRFEDADDDSLRGSAVESKSSQANLSKPGVPQIDIPLLNNWIRNNLTSSQRHL